MLENNLFFIQKVWDLSLKNKYAKWYLAIAMNIVSRGHITKKAAKKDLGYVESHHILPVSFDHSYSKSRGNILHCTGREHFILHYLMLKMFLDHKLVGLCRSAIRAFTMNNSVQKRTITPRAFQKLREICAESSLGNKHGAKTKGSVCYTNGESLRFIKGDEVIPEGFWKGSMLKGLVSYTNGNETIRLPIGQKPPNGWEEGSHTKGRESKLKGKKILTPYDETRRKKISESNSNRMWITNSIENRRCDKLADIPPGWVKGRSGNLFSYLICPVCGKSVDHGNYNKHVLSCRRKNEHIVE